MRIDDRSNSAISGAGSASPLSGTRQPQNRTSVGGGSDSVELSGLSRALQDSSASRAGRIAQLSQAVQGGTYSADPVLVSQALVRETLAQGRQE